MIKEFNMLDDNGSNVIINFITPFRAVKNGNLVNNIDFEVILKNILRRIDLISYYHCNKKLEVDFKKVVEDSKDIIVEEKGLKYYNWSRIASNNKQKVDMGGYIGYIKGNGKLENIIPFLKLGELFHIGKGCSFGMGKYKVEII
jgi:hypothetical protein